MNNQNAMVQGSLGAVARQNGTSIAESFIECDAVILVDVSGSMGQNDSRGGQQRYKVACEELARLQKNMPGKIAVLSFSDATKFCAGGVPGFDMGGTDLTRALKFAKMADVTGMRFFVISDGCPDNEDSALTEARKFKNRIDTIYVGDESNRNAIDFLKRLAAASGGVHVDAARVLELSAKMELLLGAGA